MRRTEAPFVLFAFLKWFVNISGMEINELKKMLKKSTAVLILENGEPSIVVVDYKTYKELLGDEEDSGPKESGLEVPPALAGINRQSDEMELLGRINKDILALKEQIEEEEKELDI